MYIYIYIYIYRERERERERAFGVSLASIEVPGFRIGVASRGSVGSEVLKSRSQLQP